MSSGNFIFFKLNSDLNNRYAVDDLEALADEGQFSPRIVQCNVNTLNTPYKAGLTGGYNAGIAYINASSTNSATIFYICIATNQYFSRAKAGGTWGDWVELITNADLIDGTDTRVAVKHAGGTNTRMVLDCTSPSEGYVSLEGVDGAWYRRLKFLSNGQIIYAYKATNGTEKTKVISEAPT